MLLPFILVGIVATAVVADRTSSWIPCADLECPLNHVCVTQDVYCKRSTCPPVATCQPMLNDNCGTVGQCPPGTVCENANKCQCLYSKPCRVTLACVSENQTC
ncbi:unnamed protein product [Allacma fusca]|uniref:Uncharacterized protein n=1 Tax=Allacma fusca TaxID=39272 RepID=A0A8J2PCI1_9HEXA|nr:unnamed protein product [Allacma fusca]